MKMNLKIGFLNKKIVIVMYKLVKKFYLVKHIK